MHCSQCGTKLPADANFCPNCGRACAADQQATPAAPRPPSDLRTLLCDVWGSYGILEQHTNDVDGITRQLKNRMARSRPEYLPEESTVTRLIQAVEASLADPDRTRTRKELEMAAALPDLRARHTYQIEAVHEGSGYPYVKDVVGETTCRCDTVRRRAAELLAETDSGN